MTSPTGIALFEDLVRFEDYSWAVSKADYADTSGVFTLVKDTTVNLTMNVLINTDHHGLQELIVYPNPVDSKLIIESAELIKRIDLYALYGKLVITETVNNKKAIIDVSGFAIDVYNALIYIDSSRIVTLKVIKPE